MDTQRENEATIALFFKLIDDMIGVIFVPKRGYMTDEAGGIHAACM